MSFLSFTVSVSDSMKQQCNKWDGIRDINQENGARSRYCLTYNNREDMRSSLSLEENIKGV